MLLPMASSDPGDAQVSLLLAAHRQGARDALDRALPLVYGELHRLAERAFAHQGAGHTLQPTALVSEAWLKLARNGQPFEDRHHFLAVAARAMRQVLIDHARDRGRLKRGGGVRGVNLSGAPGEEVWSGLDLLAFEDSLAKLEALHPRQARTVELRVFGELTIPEIADVLGVSERTAAGDWAMARLWLQRELQG